MEPALSRVLVTGATGYIASHIISLLLPKYLVRGTVRSLKNPKNSFLNELQPSANLELVEADLLTTKDWDPITQSCDYIIHVASPFPSKPPKNEDEVIRPAVLGTKAVLMSGIKNKVKKIVVTSSVAAIIAGHMVKTTFNEEDWSQIDGEIPAYEKSKFYAEKEVWKIYEQFKDDVKITCINPSLVLGPVISKYTSTSGDLVSRALKNEIPGIPKLNFGYVDVRDVAEAHVKALTIEESNGKRYILNAGSLWFGDIMSILRSEFSKYGYKICTREVGYCSMKFVSYFDQQIKLLLPYVGKELKIENNRSVKELGIEYRDLKKTIIETGYSFVEKGVVQDKVNKKK